MLKTLYRKFKSKIINLKAYEIAIVTGDQATRLEKYIYFKQAPDEAFDIINKSNTSNQIITTKDVNGDKYIFTCYFQLNPDDDQAILELYEQQGINAFSKEQSIRNCSTMVEDKLSSLLSKNNFKDISLALGDAIKKDMRVWHLSRIEVT
jgi:hypothetical protein